VIDLVHEYGAGDIGVFGGGGGTITHDDARIMQKKGVSRIFFAGTPLAEMIEFVKENWDGPAPVSAPARSHVDHRLGRLLTSVARGNARTNGKLHGAATKVSRAHLSTDRPRLVIGVCGPGGAGKTTLIDELVLRFLQSDPTSRIAVLSHDPSIIGNGALLGDRAAMFYSQNDRVFMRSLASSGRAGGLSPATERCLKLLKNDPVGVGFDVVLVETVGIGQEAVPFAAGMVDKSLFVMSPEYGSRLQLQKIAMLDTADIVVVNKSDLAAARTASSEVEQRLAMNRRGQQLVATVAKRHRDAGVDALFAMLNGTSVGEVEKRRIGAGVTCV
jgi:methylmalonyl-CoA mutase